MQSKAYQSETSNKSGSRLALAIHGLAGGGAERLMLQLANRWAHHHEVHLVTWAGKGDDPEILSNRIIRHPLNLQAESGNPVKALLANMARVNSLRSALKAIDPAWVLSFCDQMNIVCLEAARALPNVPVWIAEHSDPRHQRLGSIWEAWRRRSYPRCTGCVALTDSIADHLGSLIPRERIRVIPAAIANRTAKTDPTLWSQNDATAEKNSIVAVQGRASANPDGDGLRSLLFVGRLSPEKNLTLLLEAWRIVAQRLPDWQLLLVGDGPERTKLQQTAKSLPRVHFLGWCSQPDGYYQAADLYVLCSRYEGFPVALLEALSYGVPAVATRCSEALDQLVGTSQPGLRLVDSAPEALAVAIVKLAGDPSLRQQMSHAAKAVACNFTWDRIGPLWDAVLGQP